MSYSAKNIAEYIVSLANPEFGDSITNLKLQKLLYYTQGFNLAIHGQILFEENIEAWQYGPVVPEVYHEYKHLGSSAIPPPDKLEIEIDDISMRLIDEVYDVYGQFSALKLMNMTHAESPWMETPIASIITPEVLTNYFKTLVVV